MVVSTGGLHYPNLEGCRIVLGAASYDVAEHATGGDENGGVEVAVTGPVSMPPEALRALNSGIPPMHDFTVERDVLKKKAERERRTSSRRSSGSSSSSSSLEREQAVQKMRGITQADRLTCANLLGRYGYDLDRSVAAFFRGER
eukprot:CAMPEP_0197465924 /NCGR_PEP_ID=MMETSP1175-20131217/64789_1 /TAXON_ID=1003142 /ORGANISM="Triceratium dubium, Strain CCMP147" /LENGTH=143 /DNA_ID=CAMNT_0043001951 /DNA_START=124 /DNA_END=555 /DNA_ORIENTATION=+